MATNLDKDLSCPVCLEVYRDPVLLRCGHNFCRTCIQRHMDESEGVFTCPCCRAVFEDESIYSNLQLANVIAGLQDLLTQTRTGPDSRRCVRHGKDLELFCQEDNQLVCYICSASREHRYHDCVPIDEGYTECKDILKRSMTLLENEVTDHVKMRISQGDKISHLLDTMEHLREDIAGQFKVMHNFLDEKERAIIEKLADEEDRVLQKLEENVLLLSRHCDTLEAIILAIREVINSEDSYQLLQEYDSLKKRSESIYDPVLNAPIFKVDEFYGPLQYGAWKQMKNIITIVPTALHFDPRTANPYLRISNLGRKLKYCEIQSKPPDTPERFTNHLSVFASVGLTSGIHYWEINVSEGADWLLGVAAASVNRKVCAVTKPENGYWTIGHRIGENYRAYGNEKVTINLDINAKMIGIYLDYEKGQLSFYNAGDMSHIHTFNDKFTEKLYPYFSINHNEQYVAPTLELFHLQF
ncbi:zinc-binding protein A33-like [Carcharodon carcharias]|uniref:zinc-binding protein A33-like n=1 Tax=Carcharodon carcharias TaxID=13397 RepID=UPI001B7DBCD4|nr:zinc-binding protein A33-like [Carcharodon carcharias]